MCMSLRNIHHWQPHNTLWHCVCCDNAKKKFLSSIWVGYRARIIHYSGRIEGTTPVGGALVIKRPTSTTHDVCSGCTLWPLTLVTIATPPHCHIFSWSETHLLSLPYVWLQPFFGPLWVPNFFLDSPLFLPLHNPCACCVTLSHPALHTCPTVALLHSYT